MKKLLLFVVLLLSAPPGALKSATTSLAMDAHKCIDPANRVSDLNCLRDVLTLTDQKVNSAFAGYMNILKRYHVERSVLFRSLGIGHVNNVIKKHSKSQKEWEIFRDSHCRAEGLFWVGRDNPHSSTQYECRIDLGQNRIVELNKLSSTLEGYLYYDKP